MRQVILTAIGYTICTATGVVLLLAYFDVLVQGV
jgi:hypothetical protein